MSVTNPARTGETLNRRIQAVESATQDSGAAPRSFVLTESAAIIHYLSETFPHAPEVYAPQRRHESCSPERVVLLHHVPNSTRVHCMIRRHDGLKQIYGEAPVAVESAKSYFLHNIEAYDGKNRRRQHLSVW